MDIVYLDQNGLSQLAKSQYLLSYSAQIFKRKNLQLGISFPHFYETFKAPDDMKTLLIKAVDTFDWVQLIPLIRILDAEVKNEFYRFLNISKREETHSTGPIFQKVGINLSSFGEILNFGSSNVEYVKYVQQATKGHDAKMKNLMENASSDLENERKAILCHFRDTILKSRGTVDLPFELPSNSLNDQEFIDNFDWEKTPYLKLYTAFQCYRYKNITRKPSGDMADAENAILGAVGCDYLMLERNSIDVLRQLKSAEFNYKATAYSSIETLLENLN